VREVTLLGTSHDIQRGDRLSRKFKILLLNSIKNGGFSCVAEEIDDARSYIAENICNEIGISHLVVEPTPTEAEKLGIENDNKITYRIQNLFWEEIEKNGGWPAEPSADSLPTNIWTQYSEELEASYRAREQEWYKRIAKVNNWPLLFICGASHYTPFKKKLESSGILVTELCMHWDPERNET